MADDGFEVDVTEYEGVDVVGLAEEELDRTAVKTQSTWQDNMLAEGYKNTGEAINSITWDAPETLERVVGSNKKQVEVGEYGRAPDAGFPPKDAIADWVHEQQGLPNRGESVEWDFGDGPEEVPFEQVVFLIQRAIHENGLPAYGFGRKAAREEGPKFAERLQRRLSQAIDRESVE